MPLSENSMWLQTMQVKTEIQILKRGHSKGAAKATSPVDEKHALKQRDKPHRREYFDYY
mgnify:CR=1 FL=1